ncbi:MAG: rhodanese-like domain-containing protein [Treponemataceae bacterium]
MKLNIAIGVIMSIFPLFGQSYETLPLNEIKNLAQTESFILLDVRTPEEFSSGSLKNAINLDLYTMTQEKANAIISDKNTPVLVYCKSGNRSKQASKLLDSWGYKKIYNIGGYQMLVKNKLFIK